MRTASIPEYPDAPTTATRILSCAIKASSCCPRDRFNARISSNYHESETVTSSLGFELENHLAQGLVVRFIEFRQVKADHLVVRASCEHLFQLRSGLVGVPDLQQLDGALELIVEGWIDPVIAASHDFHYRHQAGLSLDLHQTDVPRDVRRARLDVGLFAYQEPHPEFSRETFQARGEINAVADNRIVEAAFSAKVAGYRISGGDADPNLEIQKARVLLAQTLQCRDHLECRVDGATGRVFHLVGSAPEGHDSIAHQLVHHPAALQDDVGHPGHVHMKHCDQLHRIGPFRQGGEPDDVSEQDGHVTPLAAQPESLGVVDHARDHVGMEIVLENVAQVALLSTLGDVAIAKQDDYGAARYNKGQDHAEHDP